MIVGGVFDRHPGLTVQLVHGGGSFPYQLGRLDHAYRAREDTSSVALNRPSSYLRNFLFDTILFSEPALRFLVELAGPGRVVFGTDIPLDMADPPADRVRRALEPEVAERVLSTNAIGAYKLAG
jgi:aminocarboxymuconate-semialdehyde decarboxylase